MLPSRSDSILESVSCVFITDVRIEMKEGSINVDLFVSSSCLAGEVHEGGRRGAANFPVGLGFWLANHGDAIRPMTRVDR